MRDPLDAELTEMETKLAELAAGLRAVEAISAEVLELLARLRSAR